MRDKSERPGSRLMRGVDEFDPAAVVTWLLGFGLVLWIGLSGGGYGIIEFGRIGVYAWWLVLFGLCLGLFPARKLGRPALAAIGLLALFALWNALALTWTDSPDKSLDELARIATYLGVFCLALFTRSSRSARRMVSAVGAAIVVIAGVGLLSRLHPAWFPEAAETGKVLVEEARRLAFPIEYWNAMGALVAVGITLMLNTASSAKSPLVRSLGAATLPLLFLTLYFTLSRSGMLAACLGLALYFALVPDRLPKALNLLAGGLGGALLIFAARQREALSDGLLNAAARDQGDEILLLTVVVTIAVGILHFVFTRVLRHWERPAWLRPDRRRSLRMLAGAAVVLACLVVVLGATGQIGDSWGDFKSEEAVEGGSGRLESASGNGRYQYWTASLDQFESEPLTGTGPGTFEYWWGENGDRPGFVRDAHSLYLQTIGETGIVGVALLLAFFLTVLIGGVRAALGSPSRSRPQLAAAAAGCLVFCVSAGFDWTWQIPVLPIVFLLLASVLVTTRDAKPEPGKPAWGWPPRIGGVVAGLAAIVAISVPLASAGLLDQSREEAASGDLGAAYRSAHRAEIAGFTARPNLQKALVLERMGLPDAALAEARIATEDEPVNWRVWLVRSRLEAKTGLVEESVTHFRTMERLRP